MLKPVQGIRPYVDVCLRLQRSQQNIAPLTKPLAIYTVGTLPSASSNGGTIVLITDGAKFM